MKKALLALKSYLSQNSIDFGVLSAKCGLSENHLRQILIAENSIDSIEYALICDALGVKYSTFCPSITL